MIERLKTRVFWSILLSASGVLLVMVIAINILQWVQTRQKIDSILNSAAALLETKAAEGDHSGKHGSGKGKTELLRSISENELGLMMLDENGEIISGSAGAEETDEETLQMIAKAAASDEDGRGSAESWNYKTVVCEGGMNVIFLNAASIRKENRQTLLLSLLGFAAACCVFAVLAKGLTQAIVKPVDENMQAQKRFVADASHELKTPLTVIDANVSVLEQSFGANKWLDYIKEQTSRMAGLVNGLLQLSDLDEAAGSAGEETGARYDAAEAVLSAALPLESVAFERGLKLETDLPESLEAFGNAQDLMQLTTILVDNAIKHSPPGNVVSVRLGVENEARGLMEKQVLVLQVSNTGEEIPPEALPHIFDRFYRADPSRAHKENSFGLGLAIAKGLAEKNGAGISATSRDGVTTFTVKQRL